jgi:LPXTG-site transpeptidase (sortase) family protein
MPKGLRKLSTIFILLGIAVLFLAYFPVIKDEIWYMISRNGSVSTKESVFAKYLFSKPLTYEPVNKDFSLVIEKIGVNVPIVRDVYTSDSKAYMEVLKSGVAHAASSPYPSNQPGNVYLFAHASTNFWQLGKYATVFNLLRKLEDGDIVHVFYQGQDFVYEVVNKETYKGWNTYPLDRKVVESVLTLQTCDPPGTTLNRLVVTARLIDVR